MRPTKVFIQSIYNRIPSFGELRLVYPYNWVDYIMHSQDDNIDLTFTVKRAKPRYINISEDIYLALSGKALRVYIALRFESDYSKDCSSVEKNITFLCNTSKVKRSHCFEALNELEDHGLLFRESKLGSQSIYWVASDLNHFKAKEEPIQDMDGLEEPVQHVDDPVQHVDYINTNSFTNKIYTYTLEQKLYINSGQQRQALIFREDCLNDPKAKELYEKLPEDFKKDKSFQDVYEECLSNYATKLEPLLVSKQRLQGWIKENIEYHKKKEIQKQNTGYEQRKTGTSNYHDAMSQEPSNGRVTYVQ